MIERLRIELLGPLRLIEDGSLRAFRPGKKALALFAYLAAQPETQFSREHLTELLWPDRFEEQGRQSLRQALSVLRKALGEKYSAILLSDDGCISLDQSLIETDLQRFEELRAKPELSQLVEAAALYREDFLQNLTKLPQQYEDWLSQMRTQSQSQMAELLGEITSQFCVDQKYMEARETAERLVAIDPANEDGQRLLIEIYARLGQKPAAIRQYKSCVYHLQTVLDVSPSEETEAVYQKVLKDDFETEQPSAPTVTDRTVEKRVRQLPRKFRLHRILFRHRSSVTGAATALFFVLLIWVYLLIFPPNFEDRKKVDNITSLFIEQCDLLIDRTAYEKPRLSLSRVQNLSNISLAEKDLLSFQASMQSTLGVIGGVTLISSNESTPENEITHELETTLLEREEKLILRQAIIDRRNGQQIWQDTQIIAEANPSPQVLTRQISLLAWLGVHTALTDGQQALQQEVLSINSLELIDHTTRGFYLLQDPTPLHLNLSRDEFLKALSYEQASPGAITGLGYSYLVPVLFKTKVFDAQDIETAKRYANQALKHEKHYVPALNLLALAAFLENDHETALKTIEQSLAINAQSADSVATHAFILSFSKDTEQAVRQARRAIELRPFAHPDWYEWVYAIALEKHGQPLTALNCWDAIEEANGLSNFAVLEAARLMQSQNQKKRAKQTLKQTKVLLPQDFTAERYCENPKHQSKDEQKDCLSAMQALGF